MSIVWGYLRHLIYDDQYPIIIGYLILVVVILCLSWRLTSRIEDKGKRVLWRSGVLAVAFAPGFFGAGHGGTITPALMSAMLVFLHANWEDSGVLLGVLFLFAIGPILATWLIIYFAWRSVGWFRRAR